TVIAKHFDELLHMIADDDVAVDELRVDVAQHALLRLQIEEERAASQEWFEVPVVAPGDECPKVLQELTLPTGPLQEWFCLHGHGLRWRSSFCGGWSSDESGGASGCSGTGPTLGC